MRRVALRGVRAHLVRFVLSVLAVALGVAFVAGTYSLRTMMSSTFTGIVETTTTADAYVRGAQTVAGGAGGSGTTLNKIPLTLTDTLARVDGVDHVSPDISGSIVLVGADGTAVQSTQAPSIAFGYDPRDATLRLTTGRVPRGDTEIALESQTLASSGLAIGDQTTVVLAGSIHPVTVVGELAGGAPFAGATIVLLDASVATQAYAPDGLVPQYAVFARPGVSESQLVDRLDAALASHAASSATAVTGDTLRAETRDQITSQLGFITTFLLVFAGISLFVGAFIISNTFAMSVRQRMREFALLRAVGASPLQVFSSILLQAAVVGLIGSGLGVAGGLGLVSALRVVFERMGMSLSGKIPLDASTVIISVLVGTVVSLLAAALPARRAALIPPVEAMRDDVAAPEHSLRVRALLGALAVVAGAATVVVAVARPASGHAGAVLGVGAAAVVIGTLLLSPVIARASIGVLAAPFVVLIRPLGRLARGNVVRNPRRTANTAGALMIGMALVGAASVLAASAQASTSAIVHSEADADYILKAAGTSTIPDQAVQDVRALPGIAAVDAFSAGPILVGTGTATPGPSDSQFAVGLDPAMIGRSLQVTEIAGSLSSTLANGQVAVQKKTAKDQGWAVGDELTLVTATSTRTVTIGAVIDSPAVGAPLVLPDDLFTTLVPRTDQFVWTAFVTASDRTDAAALRPAITAAVKPYVVIAVLDTDQFISKLAAQVNQVLVILYALLGLSIVIAVLGIVNTLALSVIERTREIGLLRAVGLGRFQLAGTVMIESVLTAVFGTVVGLGVGIALASAMPTVFADDGLSTLVVPWGSLVGMVVLSVAVGVLAALWPGVRAARMPVLEAVTYE